MDGISLFESSGDVGSFVLWGGVFFLVFGVLYGMQRWRQTRRRDLLLASGYERLEKVGLEKGLDHLELQTLQRMAKVMRNESPPNLLSSIVIFDQVAARYMKRMRRMPWLKMQVELERLTSVRAKVGFRHLPAGQPPGTTRELEIGQKLYVLVHQKTGSQLFASAVVDLDDLAIGAKPFICEQGQAVRLRKRRRLCMFFWTPEGREYRFETQIYKIVKRPTHYLLVQHNDALFYEDGGDVFAVDVDWKMDIEWLPASRKGLVLPSSAEFKEASDTAVISVQCDRISGSGCHLCKEVDMDVNHLVRIQNSPLKFLNGKVGRVITVSVTTVEIRFLDLTPEDREQILYYMMPRISPDAFDGI
ncbi:MAG: hypothetical protein ACI8V2_000333 [Candidatus Latescibacterota bacterium]|jgi:hypothetical protein